jgi:glycosyltransferase involved in cell wall biosynthesis
MHVFLEAMAILKREYPDLRIRIAGKRSNSPESKALDRQLSRLGLTEATTFLGWLDGEQVARELENARCYVNTSFIENSCNALQEAMLVGCPCVASFSGGTPTILEHKKTGLMVPPGCSHVFADAVKQLLENDALCESLGAAARQVAVRRNDPQRIVADLINAYRAVGQHEEQEAGRIPN